MKSSDIQLRNYSSMERPFGISEKLMFKMRDYGGMNVCGITSIKGNFDNERLLSALSYVVSANPILNSKTSSLSTDTNKKSRQNNTLCFSTDDESTLPFSEIILKDENALHESISRELQTELPSNGKLWKLQLVKLENKEDSCFLVATFDHTIIDGKSSYKFIEMLLTAYSNGEPQNIQPTPNISTPAEWSTDHKLNFLDIFRFITHEARKILRPLTQLTFSQTKKQTERKVKLLKISFTKEQTDQILITSRKNNTTVQGAIVAALIFSSAKHGYKPREKYRFCNASPVDFRKEARISDMLIGNYSSSIETMHDFSRNTSFWELAREVRQKLVRAKENKMHLSSLIILEYLQNLFSDNFRTSLLNGKPMGRLWNTAVSNLGEIKLEKKYGDITIEDYSLTIAQQGFGACFCIMPCTFDGSLNFFLHYIEPLTTKEKAKDVQQSITNLLLKSLSTDFTYEESTQ